MRGSIKLETDCGMGKKIIVRRVVANKATRGGKKATRPSNKKKGFRGKAKCFFAPRKGKPALSKELSSEAARPDSPGPEVAPAPPPETTDSTALPPLPPPPGPPLADLGDSLADPLPPDPTRDVDVVASAIAAVSSPADHRVKLYSTPELLRTLCPKGGFIGLDIPGCRFRPRLEGQSLPTVGFGPYCYFNRRAPSRLPWIPCGLRRRRCDPRVRSCQLSLSTGGVDFSTTESRHPFARRHAGSEMTWWRRWKIFREFKKVGSFGHHEPDPSQLPQLCSCRFG